MSTGAVVGLLDPADNDNIVLKVADQSGSMKVTFGSSSQGTYNTTGNIFVYAQAGTDSVKLETTKYSGVTYYIQDAAFVFGGDGSDTLDRPHGQMGPQLACAGTRSVFSTALNSLRPFPRKSAAV